MAPKCQRVHGSSSRGSTPYDMTRFISKASSDRYHNILVGKTPILKHDLHSHETSSDLNTMIEQRGGAGSPINPSLSWCLFYRSSMLMQMRLRGMWYKSVGRQFHITRPASMPTTTYRIWWVIMSSPSIYVRRDWFEGGDLGFMSTRCGIEVKGA